MDIEQNGKNLVFLVHRDGAYGVVVRNEDIDWSECGIKLERNFK
jgi:hypothetical protein